MSQVDGRALFELADVEGYLTEEARAQVGMSFMDVLAALHSVDPDDVGLGDLGKKEDYVGRQLRTWYRSWMASIEGASYDDPVLHELHEFLQARMPQQGPARVVHGDYGLHNSLVSPEGQITAVLDWEISTLGDPLADFAYALNGWIEADDDLANKDDAPTLAAGFSSRADLVDRYASRTGADLSDLPYYVSFNHFKTACIIHGVYARYMQGQKSTEGVDLEYYRSRIGISVELSKRAADELD